MLRGGDPVLHDLLEFLGGHARMRGHDDFEDGRARRQPARPSRRP